jgi:hypothetical protein
MLIINDLQKKDAGFGQKKAKNEVARKPEPKGAVF